MPSESEDAPSLYRCCRELPALCRGDTPLLVSWLARPAGARLGACLVAIVAGGLAYGFTLGFWRAPAMGIFVALKLPLLILLTLAVNGLINGMLAQVLGSGIRLRQTLMAMLMSFAGFSLVTGALSPITLGMAWSAPAPHEPGAQSAYRSLLLTHTAIIAFAGITAHRRFLPVLLAASVTRQAGHRVFLVWLAGNLLVGAQLSWNLRPFFGQPGREVQFLRQDWNRSSFYESLYQNLTGLFSTGSGRREAPNPAPAGGPVSSSSGPADFSQDVPSPEVGGLPGISPPTR